MNEFKSYLKRNKFNAEKASYRGRIYHSKLECSYAIKLDWMKKTKQIKDWIPQHKIDLSINGIHITNYFIDFKVVLNDGTFEYHEVKGKQTQLWILKWRLTKAIYPDYKLILIK